MVGSLAVATLGVTLAGLAWQQSVEADRQRDDALVAQSKALALLSETEFQRGDYTSAALVALEAINVSNPSPDAEKALYSALLENREKIVEPLFGATDKRLDVFNGTCQVTKHAAQGLIAEICSQEAKVSNVAPRQTLWETDNGSSIPIDGPELGEVPEVDPINGGSLSGEGSFIALGLGSTGVRSESWPGSVSIREARTGKELHRFSGANGAIAGAAISANNELVAAASIEGEVIIWNIEKNQVTKRLVKNQLSGEVADKSILAHRLDWKHSGSFRYLEPTEDFKSFWTIDHNSKTTWLFDPVTIRGTGRFKIFAKCDYPQFKPAETFELTKLRLPAFELVDHDAVVVRGENPDLVLSGHKGVPFCAFSIPERQELVTFSADSIGATNLRNWVGEVRIWDARDGRLKAVLNGHLPPEELWLSDDRRYALTLGGHWILWHTSNWTPLASGLLDQQSSPASQVFSSEADLIAFARETLPRCLTGFQRRKFGLSAAPPPWCVERRLWPYHGDDWQAWLPKQKAWLISGRRGDPPPLPKAE
ncbi:MAG: hypothetical protein HC774_02220 [Sphingomonadales bacterium]|nr:hypothetical protein [Sphingomonadales bacterium]